MEAIKLTTTSFLQRLFSSAPAPVPGVTKPIPLISFFRYRPRIKGGRSGAARPTASTSTRSFFPSRPRNRVVDLEQHSQQPQPAPAVSSPLDPETGVVDLEHQHQHQHRHQQPQSITAIGVTPHYAQPNLDWPVLVIGFCFSSAVAIAVQSLQTRAPLPVNFHLLCLAMACAVASPFVAKYIASKLPDPARVLEHAGVLFGATTFFFAITVSSPLCLKLTFWTIYALSLLVIVVCNSLERSTSFYRCCGKGV